MRVCGNVLQENVRLEPMTTSIVVPVRGGVGARRELGRQPKEEVPRELGVLSEVMSRDWLELVVGRSEELAHAGNGSLVQYRQIGCTASRLTLPLRLVEQANRSSKQPAATEHRFELPTTADESVSVAGKGARRHSCALVRWLRVHR